MPKNEGLIPDADEPLLREIVGDLRSRLGDTDTRALLVKWARRKVGPLAEETVKAVLRELYQGIPAAPPSVPSEPSVVKPPAPSAGILKSARWNKFPRVDFVAPEIESWPAEGAKKAIGFLKINGKKVEHIGKGRGWSTVVNATIAVDRKTGRPGKYYRPELKSGDPVKISISDNNDRNETNSVELIWP